MTTIGVFRDDFYPGLTALGSYQFTSISQASGVIPVAAVSGTAESYLTQSGATALTTPSAAAIIAQILAQLAAAGINQPANQIAAPFTYYVRVINTNAGTLTITAGTGVTMLGTATLATATWRDFLVTVSGAAVTFQSVGTGTNS